MMAGQRIVVGSGPAGRTLHSVSLDPDAAKVAAPGQAVGLRDEVSGEVVAGQYDATTGALSFVADPDRTFELTAEPVGELAAPFPTDARVGLERVVLEVAGHDFATYIVAGTRRPYFWPVMGPAGTSVVRGQGSVDHPHHTGLSVNYGGHSEGGSVNIWSDWDEPPYGPGGRMLHRGFRRVVTGPVFGELAQDLTYVDSDGEPFVTEVRTVRWWWTAPDRRFLDLEARIVEVEDRGTRPFLTMIRTPSCFAIPQVGKVTNSAGAGVPEGAHGTDDYYRATWVDASGPTGDALPPRPAGPPEELPDLRERMDSYEAIGAGPWNGIAVFDHPANHGYPNLVGKYSMSRQITQTHYPPADAPSGPFTFRQRFFVHDGDAGTSGVEAVAADYANPPRVEVALG